MKPENIKKINQIEPCIKEIINDELGEKYEYIKKLERENKELKEKLKYFEKIQKERDKLLDFLFQLEKEGLVEYIESEEGGYDSFGNFCGSVTQEYVYKGKTILKGGYGC